MLYIKQVILENFQNHKYTKIDFEKNINLIIGTSDAGKSSILRGINWVLYNKPNGDFVRLSSSTNNKNTLAKVTLEFSNGYKVTRIKNSTRNSIELVYPDNTIETFEKIGFEIPSKVRNIMGNPPIDINGNPIAYADQLAPLFFVSLSPTELPRSISQITGTDDFEETIQILNKNKKDIEKEININIKQKENVEEKLNSFCNIEKHIDGINLIEDNYKKCEILKEKSDSMGVLYNSYQLIKKQISISENKSKRLGCLDGVIVSYNKILNGVNITNKKLSLLSNYDKITDNINNISIFMNKHKLIASCDDMSRSIDNDIVKIYGMENILNNFKSIISIINNLTDKQQEITEAISLLDSEKTILISNLKSDNRWCNVCDQPIDKEI